MKQAEKDALMRKTSTPQPSNLDAIGDDGAKAKAEYKREHHGTGKVNQKSCF